VKKGYKTKVNDNPAEGEKNAFNFLRRKGTFREKAAILEFEERSLNEKGKVEWAPSRGGGDLQSKKNTLNKGKEARQDHKIDDPRRHFVAQEE